MLRDIKVLRIKFTKGSDWVKTDAMDGQHNIKAPYHLWWKMSDGLKQAWDQRQNTKSRSHHRVSVPTPVTALQTSHNSSEQDCIKQVNSGSGPFETDQL